MDLLGAPGPRNKNLDPQNIAALLHCEHFRDPGPDPLEVFGGADHPNEEDAAGGDGGGGVAGEEGARVRKQVRDADAPRYEHDAAVGREGVSGAVGAFDEGGQDGASARGGVGFCEHFLCEADAAADDEGDCRLGESEEVGVLDCRALF